MSKKTCISTDISPKQPCCFLHAGLFRHPTPPKPRNKQKRKRKGAASEEAEITIGTLQDLRASSKGGLDPDGE